MWNNFFSFLRRRKLEKIAKMEALKIESERQKGFNGAEYLAQAMFNWVELFWNGKKEKFLIRNVNTPELIIYGKYPNIMMKFAQDLKKHGVDFNDDKGSFDWESYKQEELQLFEKVARESMITPSFQETYDAIINLRISRNLSVENLSIRDVFPYDFLSDLFVYHLRYWELSIKKKLDASILKESAE